MTTTLSRDDAFQPRQAAVLDAALGLLVEGGEKALTTAGLARAANCSKESLYKWFGDRDGILEAMIVHQASKVRASTAEHGALRDRETVRATFEAFGVDLLTVLAGETSLALNRLAVGQASKDGSKLGALMVARGRNAVRARALALLADAKRSGAIRYDDAERAFAALYGLIVGDMHVRLLLGEAPAAVASPAAIAAHVRAALNDFYRLFGA